MRFTERALCVLLLCLSARAQSLRGTVAGTVKDEDGAPVAKASVELQKDSSKYQARTSGDGKYSIANLPPGAYEVTISSPGLQSFTKKDLSVEAGKTASLDALLKDFESLGSVGEDRTFYAAALEAHKTPSGPTPRTAAGKPDFSGVWYPLRASDFGKPDPLPWAEKFIAEQKENNYKNLPSARCLPDGISDAGTLLPFRVMQNATVLVFIYEGDLPRQIYLDGRKHPEEPLSPFVGHSVGKWDGDTLVVDTVGFNDKTWIHIGRPQTEKLHVTERMRRKDLGHLEIEYTFDDPGAYKAPWTLKQVTELAPADYEIGQYVCTENNRDVPHLVGK